MPTRVLICHMPRLLMDVVSAILAQAPGVVIVARIDGDADFVPSVRSLQPDVVVLQETGAIGQGDYTALLAAGVGLRVVAISATGSDGALYRARGRPALMQGLSAAELVCAVRGTPSRRRAGGCRETSIR
jgi:chemotaxis response regulator CheB